MKKLIVLSVLTLSSSASASNCMPYYMGCGMATKEEARNYWEEKERRDAYRAQRETANSLYEIQTTMEKQEIERKSDALFNNYNESLRRIGNKNQ